VILVKQIVVGIAFFVVVALLVRWKRPALWAKLTKPFKKKPKKVEATMHAEYQSGPTKDPNEPTSPK